MRKLLNKIKISYYIFLLTAEQYLEDIINKLNGRKIEHQMNPFIPHTHIQQESSKLRTGIKKLVRVIYDTNGRLKDEFRTSESDLLSAITGGKRTLIDRLEQAQLTQRMLDNPTDESGTDDAMVQHNVKNAPKYVASQQKRELMKLLTKASRDDNMEEVLRLRKQVAELNKVIRG